MGFTNPNKHRPLTAQLRPGFHTGSVTTHPAPRLCAIHEALGMGASTSNEVNATATIPVSEKVHRSELPTASANHTIVQSELTAQAMSKDRVLHPLTGAKIGYGDCIVRSPFSDIR